VTGRNDNFMQPTGLDVREFAGQKAVLCIVDQPPRMGHIGIDYIVFSDKCAEPPYVLEKAKKLRDIDPGDARPGIRRSCRTGPGAPLLRDRSEKRKRRADSSPSGHRPLWRIAGRFGLG
jgi:hypothetical protein